MNEWTISFATFENERIQRCLAEIKERAAQSESCSKELLECKIHVVSENNFPTAAGLASSASGYACLVYSLAQLYGLKKQEISDIARLGSGSACRSIYGGFVQWQKGVQLDGKDSIAVQVAPASHWPDLHVLILVVHERRVARHRQLRSRLQPVGRRDEGRLHVRRRAQRVLVPAGEERQARSLVRQSRVPQRQPEHRRIRSGNFRRSRSENKIPTVCHSINFPLFFRFQKTSPACRRSTTTLWSTSFIPRSATDPRESNEQLNVLSLNEWISEEIFRATQSDTIKNSFFFWFGGHFI